MTCNLINLPNNMQVQDSSKNGCLTIYDEIFKKQVYLTNGIQINDQSVVIDLGANIGLFAIWFNNLLNSNAKIHSFEPVADIANMASYNIKNYCNSNVKLHKFGVADKTELRIINYYPRLSQIACEESNLKDRDNVNLQFILSRIKRWVPLPSCCLTWLAKLIFKYYYGKKVCVACPMLSWTDLLKEIGHKHGDPIDLVKIDIEGSELSVLRSMEPFHDIKQLIIETHIDAQWGDIINLLLDYNFNLSFNSYSRVSLPIIYAMR